MRDYNRIPQELKNLDQWVCAYDDSKIPMSAYRRESASSTDSYTWAFWEQAEWAVNAGHYDHVGFVFADNGYVAIDIDNGYDSLGLLTPDCVRHVYKCKSYTEKSKSGRGVHIILKGTLPFDGKNNFQGMEIYKTKRFFILTGDIVAGYDTIIENQEAIDYIVAECFSDERRTLARPTSDRIYSPVWKEPRTGSVPLRPTYPVIGSGGRNISLTSLAGTMHAAGYSREQILQELRLVNKQVCDRPLPDSELITISRSISRYRRDA